MGAAVASDDKKMNHYIYLKENKFCINFIQVQINPELSTKL